MRPSRRAYGTTGPEFWDFRLYKMAKDLRGFLTEYERENPKEFCRIKKEVDPEYEVAGILTKLEEMRKLPILFYEKVKGSSFPVVTNVYSTKKKIAASIGVDPKPYHQEIIAVAVPVKARLIRIYDYQPYRHVRLEEWDIFYYDVSKIQAHVSIHLTYRPDRDAPSLDRVAVEAVR